jgi:DNA-binding NtrC family response regulator
MTDFKKANVLYVDDEINNLNSFQAGFRRIFITDQRMPVTTGIEFLESIISKYPDPIRILLTGYADINAVIDAINKGQVYRYIQKPWMEDDLRINIEKAFEIYTLRKDNKELIQKLLEANEQLEFLARQNLLS